MRVRSCMALLCLLTLLAAPTTLAQPASSGTIALDYVGEVVSGIVDSLMEGVSMLLGATADSTTTAPDVGGHLDPVGVGGQMDPVGNAAASSNGDDDGDDGTPEFGGFPDPVG